MSNKINFPNLKILRAYRLFLLLEEQITVNVGQLQAYKNIITANFSYRYTLQEKRKIYMLLSHSQRLCNRLNNLFNAYVDEYEDLQFNNEASLPVYFYDRVQRAQQALDKVRLFFENY